MAKREKIYLTAHPHLIAEWHPEKNGDLDPATVTHGSHKKVWWKCSARGHTWAATAYNRAGLGKGCPVCTGKKVLPGFNDLATTHPSLAGEWSPRNEFGPETVSEGSRKKVWWVCAEHSHEWVARVPDRTRGRGCPVCAGQRTLVGFNDLATTHPELSKEWSPKNEFGPESVVAGSHKRVWWVCPLEHTWRTRVKDRATKGKGCPKCCLNQTSKVEGELHRLLSEHFPDAEQGVKIGRWSVDVFLRKVRVVVEYDGAYFHKDRVEHDTQKTLDLLTRGYGVVRVREQSKQYTLSPLDVDDPHYLELVYEYSADWHGLDATVNKITEWSLSND